MDIGFAYDLRRWGCLLGGCVVGVICPANMAVAQAWFPRVGGL